MSSLGQASLGVFCDNPALGMSSLGLFCGALASDPLGEVFDPSLAVIAPVERLRVLGDREVYNAIIRESVSVEKPTRTLSTLRRLSLSSVSGKRGLEVQKNGRNLSGGQQRRTVHVIINGQVVAAKLTDAELLALLQAAELRKTDKLN